MPNLVGKTREKGNESMTGLASPSQIRMSFVRWAIVAVPLIVLLGPPSGDIGGSAGESAWYAALQKSALVPPGWVLGVAWNLLYAVMGLRSEVRCGGKESCRSCRSRCSL